MRTTYRRRTRIVPVFSFVVGICFLCLTAQAQPTKLAFTSQPPADARAGSAFSAAVTVEDAGGNPVTTDNSNVTLAIVSPATGSGTLSGTVTVPAVSGVATFSNLSISSAGIYTLQATDGTLTPATSTSFTATAAVPSAEALNILSSFNPAETNAAQPWAGLLLDGSGNLYGTTYDGGASGCGTVFEITAASIMAGAPAVITLASFNGTNGSYPIAGVIMDGRGNLYGTTSVNDGTVFEIKAADIHTDGTSTITTLASFNGANGSMPYAAPVMDGYGNLYGTTPYGGSTGNGTVWEITAASIAAGSPAITTLVSFDGFDSQYPYAGLIVDGSGNLYGAFGMGPDGRNNGGLFEITGASIAVGNPVLMTLAVFEQYNGTFPQTALIMDGSGNLYGTTTFGGSQDAGAVFEIKAAAIRTDGTSTITLLASFNVDNGVGPDATLLLDGSGNFYGTTMGGGAGQSGTVFEIKAADVDRSGRGNSTITTLAAFNEANGSDCRSGLVMDGSGNLYGTAYLGGANGNGVVFDLSLPAPPAKLVFARQPANAPAGSAFATADAPVIVNVEDANGNVVLGDSSTVTLAIVSPDTGGGTLCGTLTVQAVNGVATFNNLSISAAGIYTLQAADGTLASATSESFTATALPSSGYIMHTLATFNGANGTWPGTLIMDGNGNLYGITNSGGANNFGAVFEITAGTGAITTLLSFDGDHGSDPIGALIMDGSGNLYGTTFAGGAGGYGTVFEITGASITAGSPALTVLASFNNTNGANPAGALVMDAGGNLYGATSYGGPDNAGTVFEITAASIAVGSPAITTLASFNGTNGANPSGAPIIDGSGNLYGETVSGGGSGFGTVFEIVAGSNAVTTLISFNGNGNSATPVAGLVMDGNGNLYGGATNDAFHGGGYLFEITGASIAQNSPAVSTLASFNDGGPYEPGFVAPMIMDGSGNLYGVFEYGGDDDFGVIFKLAAGTSTLTTLLTFDGTNGASPSCSLIMDAHGNLYGTTTQIRDEANGTVFVLSAVTKLAFVQQPATAAAGEIMAQPVTVALEDDSGEVNTNDNSSSVTLSVSSGGSLSGTQTVQVVNGVATFSDLSVSPQGTYTFTATSGTLTAATSNSFTITPPPTQLAFSQQPATAQAGGTFTPAVTVTVEDVNGNVISTDSSYVTLAIGSGTLNGTLTQQAVNGVATFGDLYVNTVGVYTLTATDGALTGATSNNITVAAGAAASLSFAISPAASTAAGQPFGASVLAVDAWNNAVSGVSVTLSLPNANGATLNGTLSGTTDSNGVATFSNLSITQAGGYNLEADSTGLSSGTSNSFNITPGPATQLGFVVSPASHITVNTLLLPSPQVAIEDQYGNTVASSTAQVALSLTGGSGGAALSGTTAGSTSSGVATFANLSINQVGSNYQLSASASNLTGALSNVFGIVPGPTPVVSGEVPAVDAWCVDRCSPIELHITDSTQGVDLTTVQITASRDGGATTDTICAGLSANATFYDATGNSVFIGTTYIAGTSSDYVFVFEPTSPFDYEETVTITVSASDLLGGAMTPFSYSFTVQTRSFGCAMRADGGTSGNNFPATATCAADGSVWVAWERNDANGHGAICLAKQTDDCRDFGPEIPVTTYAADGDCHKPALAITSSGTICVAYEVHGATPSIGVSTATTAAPTAWTTVGPVAMTHQTVTLQTAPAITFVNSTGTLYVAGAGPDGSGVQQIGIGALAAGAWTVTQVTSGAANMSSPAIAQDASGIVYAVWANTGDNNIYGADSSSSWVAASWATINQITYDGAASSPAIAVENAGGPWVNLHFAWVDTSVTPNPDIQYGEASPGMWGWSGVPMSGTSLLDTNGNGAPAAAAPKVAVVGGTGTGNLKVFVVWQDNRSATAGDTDIEFAETNYAGTFGTNMLISVVPAGAGVLTNAAQSNPAFGVTTDGTPYAAWTDLREADASQIYFAKATDACLCGSQPAPSVITPSGGSASFTDPTNPHFTAAAITVPAGVFITQRNIVATELRNPVAQCQGGSSIFADGSGVYLDITGGCDEPLSDWVTVTLTLAPGATLPSPLTVYRLVPPATALDNWRWTTDLIQNVSYNPTTRVMTFQTEHLSAFGAGSAAPAGGGSGGGGCSMSPGGEPDVFILLLPLTALGFWVATRLIRRGRSTKAW